jgi:hypothetical protein
VKDRQQSMFPIAVKKHHRNWTGHTTRANVFTSMKERPAFNATAEPLPTARDGRHLKALKRDYLALLDDPASREQTVQDFLEQHSVLIPIPWMLNHGLHFDVVISKFPLDTSLVTDFAYLTKSTTEWYAVFMELESPSKHIFTTNLKAPRFSAEFNAALAQLQDWKLFVERHAAEVRDRLSVLLRPLPKNRLRFKFVLVYGRNAEFGSNQDRIDHFAELNSQDRKVLTYDSPLGTLRTRGATRKNILTVARRAFKLKYLNDLRTGLFTYLLPNELEVSRKQTEELRAAGYHMDRWTKGLCLRVNHKYPDTETYLRSDEFKQL